MKKMFKVFVPNLKKYIDYIMKLGLGELFVQFLILLIILLLACFVFVPIQLLYDFLIMDLIGNHIGATTSYVLYIIYRAIQVVCSFMAFVYLFNKRYESLKMDVAKKQEDINDIELPKMK